MFQFVAPKCCTLSVPQAWGLCADHGLPCIHSFSSRYVALKEKCQESDLFGLWDFLPGPSFSLKCSWKTSSLIENKKVKCLLVGFMSSPVDNSHADAVACPADLPDLMKTIYCCLTGKEERRRITVTGDRRPGHILCLCTLFQKNTTRIYRQQK